MRFFSGFHFDSQAQSHSTTETGSAPRRILFYSKAVAGLFLVAAILQIQMACNKKDQNTDPKILRGRIVYAANCISCHSTNPALDGPLGPSIKGSSLELVEARVLRGEYPPGYAPKRTTKMMQKLPLTQENVQDLHAFLTAP
jgi:mono/diheme cytochrome c family protein